MQCILCTIAGIQIDEVPLGLNANQYIHKARLPIILITIIHIHSVFDIFGLFHSFHGKKKKLNYDVILNNE